MMKVFLVLVSLVLMSRVDGFLFDRRSSSSVSQTAFHTSTNNCHCMNRMFMGNSFMDMLQQYLGGGFGKREAAAMLDLDEDYPGLQQFLDHVGMKRDGTVDFDDFVNAVKRQSQQSQSNSPNHCNCGRMVLDQFNDLI